MVQRHGHYPEFGPWPQLFGSLQRHGKDPSMEGAGQQTLHRPRSGSDPGRRKLDEIRHVDVGIVEKAYPCLWLLILDCSQLACPGDHRDALVELLNGQRHKFIGHLHRKW